MTANLDLTTTAGPKIGCFGDSWASFACDHLRTVLEHHGHFSGVANKGVPGMTAHYYATNPDALVALFADYKPDILWVSIGGDDLLGAMANGSTTGELVGWVLGT